MSIECPNGGHALGLELHACYDHDVFCATCDRGISDEYLIAHGVPAGLVAQIRPWALRAAAVTGLGYNGEFGAGLSDDAFAREWDEIRRETGDLVRDLGAYLPVRAEADRELFLKRDWTQEAIVEWRKVQLRLRVILEYGGHVGRHWLAELGDPMNALAKVEGIVPAAFNPEERLRFKAGFEMAVYFGKGEVAHTCEEERRVAAQLGITA